MRAPQLAGTAQIAKRWGVVMDRRTFLGRAAIMAVASGSVMGGSVAGAVTAGARRADARGADYAAGPLVEWELLGGFVTPELAALRPPRLAVYPGGLAVADAAWQLWLPHRAVEALSRHAVTVLRDPDNARRRPGAPVVADAPDTLFQASDATGERYRIQVTALEESRHDHTYPQPLYGLLDHLRGVRDRLLRAGRPYRSEGVRLIATVANQASAAAWPGGVPVPVINAATGYGQSDLRGAPARTVSRDVPRRHGSLWPAYRTPDGHVVRLAWRYLLPHDLVR